MLFVAHHLHRDTRFSYRDPQLCVIGFNSGFYASVITNLLPNMELLTSEIVVRVLYTKTCIAM